MIKIDTQLLMDPRNDKNIPDYNWHGKRILIVEDDYVNYLFFHEILSCAYACLIRAVTLQETLDMLASGKAFDLMIINVSIPGNENCRSLKRIKLLWPQLRIIAITGFECPTARHRCHPTGCDTMISQGIDSWDMCAVVNEMLHPVN